MDDMLSVMDSYCSQPTEGQEDGEEESGGGAGRETPVHLGILRDDRFNPLTPLEMK